MSFQRFLKREKHSMYYLCFWNENIHTELQISLQTVCLYIYFPCGCKDWPTNPGWQTHVNL
jgi:hypothetical protein